MQQANEKIRPVPNELLRQERQRRGWSRAYIAEQIGVADPKTIGRWERGGAFPSAYFLQKLCTLFRMQADELGLWQRENQPAIQEGSYTHLSHQVYLPIFPEMPVYDPALPLTQPEGLVGRERLLRQLKSRLCSGKSLAATTLCGLPGAGKTALALELAHADDIRHYFSDGILWVSLGPDPDIEEELKRWSRLLGIKEHEIAQKDGREDRSQAIHEQISTRKMLLIIDDAWNCEDALAFKLGGPDCAYLLTTRIPSVALYFASTSVCGVETLDEKASLSLLARFVPAIVEQEPITMSDLARQVGGLPLALQLIGRYLQIQEHAGQPRRWHAALARLKFAEVRLQLGIPRSPLERQMGLPADAPLSLQTAINLSYQRLDSAAQRALLALATQLSTPGGFLEESALELSEVSLDALDSLLDAGLLASIGLGRYTLHETIVDFARLQQNQQRQAGVLLSTEKTTPSVLRSQAHTQRKSATPRKTRGYQRTSPDILPALVFTRGEDTVTLH